MKNLAVIVKNPRDYTIFLYDKLRRDGTHTGVLTLSFPTRRKAINAAVDLGAKKIYEAPH